MYIGRIEKFFKLSNDMAKLLNEKDAVFNLTTDAKKLAVNQNKTEVVSTLLLSFNFFICTANSYMSRIKFKTLKRC